jgi:type VII secretion integral membrane protein EccD
MTLPPNPSELESEPDAEELSRITVLVGELLIDVGVPGGLSVSAVVNDVIGLANDQLRTGTDANIEFDNTEGKWTFAHLSGGAIDPNRSLAETGVYDGEILLVQEVGAPASSLLVDDVEGMTAGADGRARWWAENAWMAAWFALGIVLAAVTAFLLPDLNAPAVGGVPIAAGAALGVGLACAAGACVMPYRSGDPRKSAWLAGVALPLIFGGASYVVPDVRGVSALAMALALTALVVLVQQLVSGRGLSLYTTVIALAVLGAPAAVARLLFDPNPRAVGAVLAAVSVFVVYLAPRATIMLSRLPVPRVPTAGEPLDDIETQGGTTVEGVNAVGAVGAVGKQVIPTEEGMTDRVRRARERLTGIVAAAGILMIVGTYLALDVSDGFYWQGAAFAIAVATVSCLRGRSHHDLVQSAVLIGGGLVIALAVIVKTATFVEGWQVKAAVALVALTAVVVMCGLVAPRIEFSPVMRRRVEILEYVAIALVLPLTCWIIGLFAFFRELRI